MYISLLMKLLPFEEPPLLLLVDELDRTGGTSTCWMPLRAWICALILAAAAAVAQRQTHNDHHDQRDRVLGAAQRPTHQQPQQGRPEETWAWSRRARCRGIPR